MKVSERLRLQKDFITVMELCKALHVSKQVIYNLMKKGEIPFNKMASSIRLDPSEIADWLDRSEYKVVIHHHPRRRN